MTPYPYPRGTRVSGADAGGKSFSGAVTETPGPYTVLIDDSYYTPVSLITSSEAGTVPVASEEKGQLNLL